MNAHVLSMLFSILVLLASFGPLGANGGTSRTGEIATRPADASNAPVVGSSLAAMNIRKLVDTRVEDTSTARAVEYDDRASFGPPHSGIGWMTTVTSSVTTDRDTAVVNLNVLFDATTGGLVAVFTNPSEEWTLPAIASQDAEELLRRAGWDMGNDIPEHMESTAVEAIAAAWREDGFDPRRVGQIIARPRWISARFPAREVNGQLEPLRPTQRVWLVQVCGVRLNETVLGDGAPFYDTGKILQFMDGSLEYVRGIFIQ